METTYKLFFFLLIISFTVVTSPYEPKNKNKSDSFVCNWKDIVLVNYCIGADKADAN